MLFSTEQVSKYHPDKYADQIADAILTECIKKDKNSHCNIEILVQDETVILAGNITCNKIEEIDFDSIIKRVANKLKYNVSNVIKLVTPQSQEIFNAVSTPEEIGAGDQGIMFGYACNETESMLPYPVDLANRIIKSLEKDVEENPNTILIGDAKTQVTVNEENKIKTILISACHKPEKYEIIKEYIETLIRKELQDIPKETEFLVNPAGSWTIGGPVADSGLTGRKLLCDQYGGYYKVGGGALSGKDPSKVDRTATYMARHIACEIVKMGYKECEVQLAYAIGVPEPVSVNVTADGRDFTNYVKQFFSLTPKGMTEHLKLTEWDFEKISEGCHFRNIF